MKKLFTCALALSMLFALPSHAIIGKLLKSLLKEALKQSDAAAELVEATGELQDLQGEANGLQKQLNDLASAKANLATTFEQRRAVRMLGDKVNRMQDSLGDAVRDQDGTNEAVKEGQEQIEEEEKNFNQEFGHMSKEEQETVRITQMQGKIRASANKTAEIRKTDREIGEQHREARKVLRNDINDVDGLLGAMQKQMEVLLLQSEQLDRLIQNSHVQTDLLTLMTEILASQDERRKRTLQQVRYVPATVPIRVVPLDPYREDED